MSRRLAWLLVADSLVAVLLARRYLDLRDAWQRQAHALDVHEQAGGP